LQASIASLQETSAKIAVLAAQARSENQILALVCSHLIARACIAAQDHEQMFQYIIESLEESVSEVLATDPNNPRNKKT
jgi:hypothetical protein